VVEDDYGFFDDISAPVTGAARDDQGYGFFGDAPQQDYGFLLRSRRPQLWKKKLPPQARRCSHLKPILPGVLLIERHRPPVSRLQYASA